MKAVSTRKTEQERWFIRTLAFFLPVFIMLALFVGNRIYPFGDRSFLSGDLYHQYMPFFSELLRMVKSGEDLHFSFHLGIGSNFLALFVYYLASPFNALALLVPERFLAEFIGYMTVVKIGLCGLSCCFYLQEHQPDADRPALFFSLFYALSGFMAAYSYNIMWVDCVMLLPLIVLGLERLVKEGRFGLYCVTLALSIYTNYYLSIMICMFLTLYFVALLVTNGRRIRSICYFVLFSLLAGGMAGILLVPEVCAILQTDFGQAEFPTQARTYFSVLDVLARHFMCVETERGLDHWPNIYCGSVVLMLVPMYAVNPRIPIRERFCKLALAGVMLLSFGTNIADFVWHGMNYPDSLPARQSFLYIFLILGICCDMCRRIDETEPRHILYGYLAAVGFYLFCEKFVDQEDFYFGVKLLTMGAVTVYGVLLYLHCTRKERKFRNRIEIIALIAAVAELFANTGVTSVFTTSRSKYLDQLADYKALYEKAAAEEEGFYRLEKFTRTTKNDGALTGIPTASLFSSTQNSDVMRLYERLGMRYSKVFYGFDGATAFTSALLNVHYMFGEAGNYENSLYTLAGQSGQVYLFRCEKTLPFGYVAPWGFDLPEDEGKNGLELQNLLVRKLGISRDLFEREPSGKTGGTPVFEAPRRGIYYAVLTASGTKKINCIGADNAPENYADLKKDSVLYLGYLEEGQTVSLANGDEEDSSPGFSADFYRMDEDVLDQALEALSAGKMEQIRVENDQITGEISLTEPGRLILTAPAEGGWRMLINGEPAEYGVFGGCLVAVDLEPGDYSIQMRYVPEGRTAGIVVSAVSLALFAGGAVLIRKRSSRRRERVGGEPLS